MIRTQPRLPWLASPVSPTIALAAAIPALSVAAPAISVVDDAPGVVTLRNFAAAEPRTAPGSFTMGSWHADLATHPGTGGGESVDAKRLRAAAGVLRDALGPAWRVEGPDHAETGRLFLALVGPESLDRTRAPALRTAVNAAFAAATIQSERSLAEAVDAAMPVRVESEVMQLGHADGEQVAAALKAALPWASFASVGGAQIVASGTRAELETAKRLVQQLDLVAEERARRIVQEFESRSRETPAWRILAKPISIDFKGGPLAEFVRLLGGAVGCESWMLEDPRLESAVVPPIKLTGVTADSALRMLNGLSFASVDRGTPLHGRFVVQRIDAAPGSDGAPPIYRIGGTFPSEGDPSRPPAPPRPTTTTVFEVSLLHLRDSEDAEATIEKAQAALLAAIEVGINLRGPSSEFAVKLHRPTGLLFVSGTPEELSLVHTIIEQWASLN